MGIRGRCLLPLAVTSLAVASCSSAAPSGSGPAHASPSASASPRSPSPRSLPPAGSAPPAPAVPGRPLPAPAGLVPFGPAAAGQGVWRPAGRPVAENGQSVRAVYGAPPDQAERAFGKLDQDRNGVLDAAELTLAIREFFASRDPGGYGNVAFGHI